MLPDVLFPGTFKLTLEFTEEYPNKAPIVKFKSTMFHPNSECRYRRTQHVTSMHQAVGDQQQPLVEFKSTVAHANTGQQASRNLLNINLYSSCMPGLVAAATAAAWTEIHNSFDKAFQLLS